CTPAFTRACAARRSVITISGCSSHNRRLLVRRRELLQALVPLRHRFVEALPQGLLKPGTRFSHDKPTGRSELADRRRIHALSKEGIGNSRQLLARNGPENVARRRALEILTASDHLCAHRSPSAAAEGGRLQRDVRHHGLNALSTNTTTPRSTSNVASPIRLVHALDRTRLPARPRASPYQGNASAPSRASSSRRP